jgi:hypothetical protein
MYQQQVVEINGKFKLVIINEQTGKVVFESPEFLSEMKAREQSLTFMYKG